ncbi:hypothetical protein, conserved [Trypanosoma brucei gambiense DAL972]|uniref:TRUD domain-containing protein n=1 Tax=Trypanosoma brucei gambiense (strain MHOM/CI/86/DAL972) TaxID=679716 RepID=D0A420_TRYB9|nr:hypothetical protein, conserved [Trypanosoma brucei gambiense DAL972]CBH16014.1 hypothetical protein, conserved [Trypanosoma brucei gambiense DAL972]|eukprot:XP_011778278.1 hypothetical protein, conserved [Trypanosoma brucei gambiense DAL972]
MFPPCLKQSNQKRGCVWGDMTVVESPFTMHDRERLVGIRFSLLNAHLVGREGIGAFKRLVVSMKTLYSDFVVRELSLLYNDGKPLVLESLQHTEADAKPHDTVGAKRQRDAESGGRDGVADIGEVALEGIRAKLEGVVPAEELDSVTKSLCAGEPSVTLRCSLTKPQRTRIHEVVRELLGGRYISRAESGTLVIERATDATRRADERRLNPVRSQKFLHFTLYKENIDSNHALREVASYLHVPTRSLLFSGTKDKRAVTLQRVAVRGVSPEKLIGINSRSFGQDRKVKVCSFRTMDHGLRLGDAVGNHFLIALRLLPESRDIDSDTLNTVESTINREGVVNYFGTQRFGTTDVLTGDVGIQLLSGHFENALRLVFRSKSMVEPSMLAAVDALEKGSFEEAVKLVPHYCHQERDMLNHLVDSPNDFLGSFSKIPRTMSMMYFHAVQSLIWNIMASKRLEVGVVPQVGDLVLKSRYTARLRCNQQSDCLEGLDLSANEMDDTTEEKERGLPEVVHLTTEDVATGLFQIADILLPVPGPDEQLQYPTVSACDRSAYIETLALKGAESLVRASNPLVKLFHYHGAYRHLVVKPRGFRMRLCNTKSLREPIIPTDLELLTGSKGCVEEATGASVSNGDGTNLPCKAIVVEFSLPPGAYATCVLREFCDCRTEGYHRASSKAAGNSEPSAG